MKNIFTKKRKIFTNALESRVIRFVVAIVLIFTFLYFLFASFGTIWQQYRCNDRGYIWFAIPPTGKPQLNRYLRDSIHSKTAGYYKENYDWGVCVNMQEGLK